jgi:hypothetical protein
MPNFLLQTSKELPTTNPTEGFTTDRLFAKPELLASKSPEKRDNFIEKFQNRSPT